MSDKTAISWTNATFNPWWGCAKVSLACDHCYAERDAKRFAAGKVLWGVDAERRVFGDAHWNGPVLWNKKAEREGKRLRVFCASMADVFDKNAPEGARERLWALIEATPHLDWLLLTKRIGNAERMLPLHWVGEQADYPANVRIGITVIDQEEADRDIPKLLSLRMPNFLSIEPMLGPIRLGQFLWTCCGNTQTGAEYMGSSEEVCCGDPEVADVLDWVIVGGESGPNARPMHPDWARALRDQCAAAGVPFHFKQWGEWVSVSAVGGGGAHHYFEDGATVRRVGKKDAGRLLDGVEHNGFPR